MKTELTLSQLAAIGAGASQFVEGKALIGNLTVHPTRSGYAGDQPFREAFARAVRDVVLGSLTTATDPYAEMKKAHAQGKVIQHRFSGHLPWNDTDKPEFLSSREYRIKPDEPETFEAHGKTWTKHKAGDPMPCDGAELIHCLVGGDLDRRSFGTTLIKALHLRWTAVNPESDIIGWRYADEQPNPSVAGACAKCGCDVLHREGKAGEFDHECPKEIAEPETPSWTPAVGDIVQLKSGGPKMTVAVITPEKAVICYWFNGDERDSAIFPQACLTLVTE